MRHRYTSSPISLFCSFSGTAQRSFGGVSPPHSVGPPAFQPALLPPLGRVTEPRRRIQIAGRNSEGRRASPPGAPRAPDVQKQQQQQERSEVRGRASQRQTDRQNSAPSLPPSLSVGRSPRGPFLIHFHGRRGGGHSFVPVTLPRLNSALALRGICGPPAPGSAAVADGRSGFLARSATPQHKTVFVASPPPFQSPSAIPPTST